ncbi:hypothetical protein ASE06_12680 [Sphingopyxis sp. Root214]|uniref:hypothetical protein n=1 Tax=unclassified Sphingopyxis TaxID=2614943 RepID=UPI0006F34F61|nr:MULTISPECIES: hypothetical protein [unclassified Sphingopyxis]KQZ73253.1 hypothetical protein ASD73_10330 [Sphingopyxis sp. Root154]KRC07400.1 hypothetical protein ASE06_12680 [Sphingopyxis sp. Root214]
MLMQSKCSPTPPKARFNPRRFLFLAALWMTIGAFVGFIVAGANGVAPDSWIPFVVIGFIAASFLFTGVFVTSISRNLKPMLESAQSGIANRILESAEGGISPGRRVLARVGKLEEAGLTVSNFNHMFIFTLTVFPEHDAPYETVIRQFITMGELPNFYTGRFVVFVEDPESPGYGLIDKDPPEEWQQKAAEPPPAYKTQKAEMSYPDKGTGFFGGELSLSAGMSPLRLTANLIATLVFLVLGFLAPFALVTGGIETVATFAQDLPKTLTGRDEGNFDKEKLRKAYDRAIAYAGNRQIYRMNIYKDYVKLTIENPSQENAYDDITMRGAVVDSRPDGTSSTIKPEETFRVSDTNFAALEHALGDALMHGDKNQLSYIGFRNRSAISTIRIDGTSGITIDERKFLVLTVGFNGDYGSISRTYDVATGQFLN